MDLFNFIIWFCSNFSHTLIELSPSQFSCLPGVSGVGLTVRPTENVFRISACLVLLIVI